MRLSPVFCLFLAACGTTYAVPTPGPTGVVLPAPASSTRGETRTAADFRRVAARVEPVAEQMCREEAPAANCDYVIAYDTDPTAQPNAFQSLRPDGRPMIVVTAPLVAQMRADDEIAFVLSHEASHHIAGHIAKQSQQTTLGALVMGGLVAATGQAAGIPATDAQIRQAMDLGAYVGARAYSQSYEFEADALGAYITARAGYDPEAGAAIFGRPALENPGGPPILASHPASAERLALIARVAADIRAQQAAGLVPTPPRAR